MQLVQAREGGGCQVASAVYCCGVLRFFAFLPPSSAPDAAVVSRLFFFLVWGRIYRSAAGNVASRVESSRVKAMVPEDVWHYDSDALDLAADGGAARIAEGEEW
jgi:hypothetical protein